MVITTKKNSWPASCFAINMRIERYVPIIICQKYIGYMCFIIENKNVLGYSKIYMYVFNVLTFNEELQIESLI